MRRLALVLAAACAAVATFARAQERGPATDGSPAASPPAQGRAAPTPRATFAPGAIAGVRRLTPAERQERRFLQDAAASLRLQADAAQLAETRAGSAAVRELAAAMAAHAAQARPQVLRLLHARGMAPPLSPVQHHRILKQLARAKGAHFDRAFVEEVALGSQAQALAEFEHMAVQAQEPALQAWAAQAVPTLRYNVALAQRALPPARAGGVARPHAEAARRGAATAPGSR